jgi:hypothetical protein
MKFDCINNQFVELSIAGYEFPEITDEWDSNWLFVHINVKSNENQWDKIHPAITTFELKWLIDWFKNISKNKIEKYKQMNFTEPNISFELINNFDSSVKNIKIHFVEEFNPITDVGIDYCIEFNATNEQLRNYSKELKTELKKYPERVKFKKPSAGT